MPSTTARSPSPMSDTEDEQVSDTTEVEESATAEAGPSSEPEAKASSSGKGKGKGGGQQNRARVTVVCAECKRLKLRCDRQQPCSNCKAKDKIDKCIYSQEAAAKVDVQSVHNRVMAVEIVIWSMSIGLPVVEFESTHPAVVAEMKRRVDDYLARGGKLLPGSNMFKLLDQEPSSSDTHDGDDGLAKGSLLSDLHDLPHQYTHIILESEGESFNEFCTCDHDLCTSATDDSGKVKEEDGREHLDVNMNQDVVPERQPKSSPKAGPTLPSVSHLPDAMSDLPPLKVYYPSPQVTEEATPSFYPAALDSKKAYVGANSPPVTPSTTDPPPPLGKSNAAPRSGPTSKPSVTPALIQCLPTFTRCNELLGAAQTMLGDIPIELGLRSRTAALPQELIDKFPGEMSKATGWVALTKRVKRCLNRRKDQQPRPSPRHKATPAASSPTPIAVTSTSQAPKDRKRAQAAAVYGRAGEVNFKDKDSAPPLPPLKLDPRILSHKEKERSKPKPPASTTQSHSTSPLPLADESLPFFAVICSLLAFGADPAKDRDTGCKESAPYLLALAQQALGLWVDGGEHLATERTDEAVKEARADYFRACSLAIQFYLMRAGPSVSSSRRDKTSLGPYRHPNERQLVNLMSKMVTQLAAWDYEEGLVPVRDAEEGPLSPGAPAELKLIPKIAVAEGQEARTRLLWQVMFYDTCIAGMFQREPLVPRSRHATTALPTLVPDYHEMVADVLKASGVRDVNGSPGGGEPSQPAPADKPGLKERREVEEERMRTDRLYVGLRARITQLSSVVDRRLAKGYSLEQAATLASEVRALFEGLPAELCWGMQKAVESTSSELLATGESLESVTESPSPSIAPSTVKSKGKGKGRAIDGSPNPKSARLSLDQDDSEVQLVRSSQEPATSKLRTRTLGCELALMAQLLVVRIYSPFAPKLAATPSDSPPSSTFPDALLDASKAIIRVAKLIHRPAQAFPTPSTLLAIYPFDQLVLDATLICTQHCFGGTVIRSKKDDKLGVQKKDSGSAELMQTIGIGLDLLDVVRTTSEQASSSSSSAHTVSMAYTLEAKVVASLRKQWSLKNSSFSPARGCKRTRSTMEGKNAGASVEPAKKAPSPLHEESSPGTMMEEQQGVSLATPGGSRPEGSTPKSINQPLDPSQPPASPCAAPAVPLNPETRVLGREVVERKRGKAAHASSTSQVGVRSRGPGATNATKRKQDAKSQVVSQPLMTTAARTVKEDGKLGYVDEDQAPNAPQRPPTVIPPPVVHQITPPQHPAQPCPPSHPYGGYDSATSTQAPYSIPSSNPSPASQYHRTFEGGTVTGDSVPPTPYQEYSGYVGYHSPQTAQHPSYPQQHHPAYAPHPQVPIPSSAPAGIALDGYLDHQHSNNSGYANHSGYGPSTGADVYMKQAVAHSSYSTLAYPGELPNAPGSSMSTWQSQQATPVQMQQPLPQHNFTWQAPLNEHWP